MVSMEVFNLVVKGGLTLCLISTRKSNCFKSPKLSSSMSISGMKSLLFSGALTNFSSSARSTRISALVVFAQTEKLYCSFIDLLRDTFSIQRLLATLCGI